MKRRLLGAAVGFAAGAAVGFAATLWLYGTDLAGPPGWATRLAVAGVVGAIGALLGALSGITKG